MSEINISPPNEVFEPGHAAQEKVDREEREYMLAEVGELSAHWENAIDHATERSGSWSDIRQEIYDNYQIQSQLRDRYNDSPMVQRAYDNVNFVFGTLPGNYVDSVANLLKLPEAQERYSPANIDAVRAGNPEISVSNSFLHGTEWHNQAIWSLLRLRNNEVIPPETMSTPMGKTEIVRAGRTLPEVLVPAMAKLFHRAMPSSVASRELGASLSGMYGAVRMARTARKAGLEVYLPPAPWDAFGKVDLILVNNERNVMAPTQIKSTTKPGGARQLFPDAPSIEFGGVEVAPHSDWQALSHFCEQVSKNPEWQAKGFQIEPKWATIYDARTDIEGFSSLVSSQPDPRDVSMIRI